MGERSILGPFESRSSTRIMSRLIAISDIHGCATALTALLRAIAPVQDDVLVLLGDYVDRGSQSADVLEVLVHLVSQCQVVPLIGNHEIMMINALKTKRDLEIWRINGGIPTIYSYGGDIRNIPQHHIVFLNHCVRFFESRGHFFVHASYDPDLPLDEQSGQVLFWEHVLDNPPGPHVSGKKAIVGHTPQEDFEIRDLGHLAIIDTFCVGGGWLTGLEVETGRIWQTNNFGQLRRQGH
jgi:serine/threonine protein phosphatase 1